MVRVIPRAPWGNASRINRRAAWRKTRRRVERPNGDSVADANKQPKPFLTREAGPLWQARGKEELSTNAIFNCQAWDTRAVRFSLACAHATRANAKLLAASQDGGIRAPRLILEYVTTRPSSLAGATQLHASNAFLLFDLDMTRASPGAHAQQGPTNFRVLHAQVRCRHRPSRSCQHGIVRSSVSCRAQRASLLGQQGRAFGVGLGLRLYLLSPSVVAAGGSRDGDHQGGDKQSRHDGKGKDPLEGDDLAEELGNANGGGHHTEVEAHGVILSKG